MPEKDATTTSTTTAAPAVVERTREPEVQAKTAARAAAEASAHARAAGAFGVPGPDEFATKATGELVKVPRTPEEIAKAGTANASFAEGGGATPTADEPGGIGAHRRREMDRVWAMDGDQTVANRHLSDQFSPDYGVRK